jgi:putative flippase GtrA
LVGAATAVVYIALGLFLSGPVGLDIQIAIVIAYAIAVAMHFLLQRFFVWSHHGEFALPARQQLVRYGLMTAAQYAFVALVTALAPKVVPLSEKEVYVLAALIAPVGAFLVMRFLVFHGNEEPGS